MSSDESATPPEHRDDPQQEPELLQPPAGAFPSMGALSGLGQLFGQARQQLDQASEEAAHATVTGRAGGGAVEVVLTGDLEVTAVRISPEIVDPGDVGMLEDLLVAAMRQALSEALEVRERAAESLLGPGLDLEAMMGSLFGGAGPGTGPLAGLGDLGDLVGELLGTAEVGELEGDEDESDEDESEDPS